LKQKPNMIFPFHFGQPEHTISLLGGGVKFKFVNSSRIVTVLF